MVKTTLYASVENATVLEYHIKSYSVTKNDLVGHNNLCEIYESIGIMAVKSVFCLLGILGNGLVLWFGIFIMEKTVNVLWFLSLAVADFSFAFIFLLNSSQISITYYLSMKSLCKFTFLFMHINIAVSVLQITVISVDRCICVVFPVWCHNHRRPKLAFIIVLIIWIISMAVAIYAMIYTDVAEKNYKTRCIVKMDNASFRGMMISKFVFFFFLPFVIIVSSYTVIVLHIRRKRSLISSKPLKTSVGVVVAFLICWLSNALFYTLVEFGGQKFDFYVIYYGSLTGDILIVVNSCIIPILYVFIGRDFKEKFCGSFQAKFEQAFMEEDKSEKSTARQRLS